MSDIITQAETIDQEFGVWIRDNSKIYQKFEEQAKIMYTEGHIPYAARTIAEWIRHHTMLTERNSAFKLNNNAIPKMARLFVLRNPDMSALFRMREAA